MQTQQYPQQPQGQMVVQQTTNNGPLHSQGATIAYGVVWLVVIILYFASFFALLGEVGSALQFIFTSLILPQIIVTVAGAYSLYTWQRASVDVNYVPNSAGMIGGIIACAIVWGWLAYVAAALAVISAVIAAVCNDVNVTCVGSWRATFDAFVAGAVGYLIMATATMIVFSVDHVAYFGCCCNGTGRAGGGAGKTVTTTVVVQQQPVPMQTM